MEIQLSDKVIEIEQKGKISEIFKNEIEKSKYEVIAAKFNNEYVNLDYEIKESGKLEQLYDKDSKFASYKWLAKTAGFIMLFLGLTFLFLMIYDFIEKIF